MSITTDRRSSLARADDPSSEPSDKRTSLGLSAPQVIGGALAAATSAVAASSLGVAGTLIGAVVGSLVATIAAALYSHSLVVAATQLRVVRPVALPRLTGASNEDDTPDGAPDRDLDQAAPAPTARGGARRVERAWLRLTTGLALGVVLALAGITAVELIIGHPVSGSTTSGTTVGQAVGGAQRSESSATTPFSPTATNTHGSSVSPTDTGSATSEATTGAQTPTSDASSSPTGPGTGSATTGSPASQTSTLGQPVG